MTGKNDRVGYPSTCFNGANHFQMGWYSDRVTTLDPDNIEIVTIAAFSDYDLTVKNLDYVIARTGDYYIQYNRATGMNAETQEFQNDLTVVHQRDDRTDIIAALQRNDSDPWRKMFQGTLHGKSWVIEICSVIAGTSSTPDRLEVAMGYGTEPPCPVTAPPEPTCSGYGAVCTQHSDCCSNSCKSAGGTEKTCRSGAGAITDEDKRLPGDDERERGGQNRHLRSSHIMF